jgi:hypothetical protein
MKHLAYLFWVAVLVLLLPFALVLDAYGALTRQPARF